MGPYFDDASRSDGREKTRPAECRRRKGDSTQSRPLEAASHRPRAAPSDGLLVNSLTLGSTLHCSIILVFILVPCIIFILYPDMEGWLIKARKNSSSSALFSTRRWFSLDLGNGILVWRESQHGRALGSEDLGWVGSEFGSG